MMTCQYVYMITRLFSLHQDILKDNDMSGRHCRMHLIQPDTVHGITVTSLQQCKTET